MPLPVGDGTFRIAPAGRSEPSSASPGARYTRAWRARQQTGRIQLRLECDEAGLAIALIDRGLLDFNMADDRVALTRAAEQALALFCAGEGSPPDGKIYDTLRIELALRALRRKLRHGSSPKRRREQRTKSPRAPQR